ncbi:EAL domain-containing protein [Photobacterium angustum]|uniref:EAL domain-containing protein n=2 Tax=Photobacterium angustum TaxID=661 RepID=A0A855SD09_PHOAN|nr:EAL domain-containing protein [Photobacterium angustum]KJF80012.1 diguanylate phosphodiesterase [Photobacterium damselae subsp. damselae]KJG01522.1 diguanylate phosphodiesterase [Photobacterium angustum]KJG15496.1 diguanylate phosphodiesterase [Photobacterium angustum]KJG20679.1 diguanylate phosphodiesterase [Photobacterium angustum]KJG27609.1 diguanylate phosphodiesterase [Photobacterium angustum]
MNNNFLLRWKQPFIILIIGLSSIFLMQYFIKVSLFQYGLYNRVNLKNKVNEPDTMVFDSDIDALVPKFYLSDNEGVALSTGLEKLIPKLSFTCSKHDIKEMRLANDLSSNIHFLGLFTPYSSCSNYGINSPISDNYNKENAITIEDYVLTPYLGSRLKIIRNLPNDTHLITITDPLNRQLYFNNTNDNNVVINLVYKDKKIHIQSKIKNNIFYHEFKEKLTENIYLEIFVTKKGLTDIVHSELLMVNVFLCILLVITCIFLGLRPQRRTIKMAIDRGIKRKEFIPFYQPIINSMTGSIVGCESLIRWCKANGEIISPANFIDIAEQNKQIYEITDVLISHVTNDIAKLNNISDDFFVSINVVPRQLQNQTFATKLLNTLSANKVSNHRISIEVTERTPFTDLASAKAVMQRLVDNHIGIKLDDAGTGFGGFSYFQELPIRTLKIDKMFIDTIGTSDVKANILNAIISFGKKAKLTMIAEGVETQEQVNYLKTQGIFLIQGFFYAKPMPFSDLEKYIDNNMKGIGI